MYHIIETLQGIQQIHIDQFNKRRENQYEENHNTADLVIHLGDTEIPYPIKLEDWYNNVYNNVYITGGNLKSDLVILQDYGDHASEDLKDWLEVPRGLVIGDLDSSIGWYDGYLVICEVLRDHLFVFKLCEFPKIDPRDVGGKRPYNFKFLIPKNYSMDSNLTLWIDIQAGYASNYKCRKDFQGVKFIKDQSGLTYGDITHPEFLQSMLSYYPIAEDYLKMEDEQFLNRDYLVSLGFSYDGQGNWIKDNLVIHDNQKLYPNQYYWIDLEEDGEPHYIFYRSEVNILLSR